MPEPTKITLVIADNPLRGLPGQTDFSITVSGEPEIDFTAGDPLPDIDTMPTPYLVAMEMIHHITGMTHEAVFMQVMAGSDT